MALSKIGSKSIADGSITADDLAPSAVPSKLAVGTRTTNVNVNIVNGSFTVVARTGNISVGVV